MPGHKKYLLLSTQLHCKQEWESYRKRRIQRRQQNSFEPWQASKLIGCLGGPRIWHGLLSHALWAGKGSAALRDKLGLSHLVCPGVLRNQNWCSKQRNHKWGALASCDFTVGRSGSGTSFKGIQVLPRHVYLLSPLVVCCNQRNQQVGLLNQKNAQSVKAQFVVPTAEYNCVTRKLDPQNKSASACVLDSIYDLSKLLA